MSAYHLWDGGGWTVFSTLPEAQEAAEEAISNIRDCGGHEWDASVEEVAVYEAPRECDEPEEDGACVLVAHEIVLRQAKPDEPVDYWSDYVMAPPRPAPLANGEDGK